MPTDFLSDHHGVAPGITAPRAPTAPSPMSFPFAATVAPVAVSLALFAVTRSPFALLFAVLGPVIAVASLIDGVVHARRRRRREWRRFETEAESAREAIASAHRAERRRREMRHPAISELVASARDPGVWPAAGVTGADVRLGTGVVESDLRFDRATGQEPDGRVDDLLAALALRASRLEGAPFCLDARDGVGFCGAPVASLAAARAFALRLARVADPASWELRVRGDRSWEWLDALPHVRAAGAAAPRGRPRPHGPDTVEFVPCAARGRTGEADPHPVAGSAPALRIAVADEPDVLPRWCRIVVLVDAAGTCSVRGGGERLSASAVQCDLATVAEALRYGRMLRALAESEGRVDATLLPGRVEFADVIARRADTADGDDADGDDVREHDVREHDGREHDERGLVAHLGATAGGPWRIDLVADGPHAVVGGTTGSGKSELLVTWVLALAARYPPDRITFLLVDFKGGSAFDALSALPHRVGTITDLDPAAARRALESLRAEILFRETALAAVGARSIDDTRRTTTLARLVIVVDEFAVLASSFPELHTLFADLAARGRSLGIHLVLCTQRPAVSLRDAILANCTLRISLRVNDAGDSSAILGTGAAATLPRHPVGRALVSIAGDPPFAVQIAVTAERDAEAVVRRWPAQIIIRRPWCEPLPAFIPADELPPADDVPGPIGDPAAERRPDEAVVFGILDLPQEQRQPPAVWRPGRDGALLVLGGHGSGKSTVLATIARACPGAVIVPRDVEGAWDLVSDAVGAIEHTGRAANDSMLLFDDVDALVGRFGRDHELEFVGLLSRLLRDGPRHGIVSVLAAASPPSLLQTSIEGRLILRMPDRQEHLMAGGSSSDFDERLAPGAGRWRGDRVQIGWTAPPVRSPPPAPPPLDLTSGRATAVVSSSPGSARARFAAAAGRIRLVDLSSLPRASGGPDLLVADAAEHLVLLGDPEAWQTSWNLLGAARRGVPLVFDGCSVAEFRAVTRTRRLPPALDPSTRHSWLLTPDDELMRVALPGGTR